MEPDPRLQLSDAYALGCSLLGGSLVVLMLLALAVVQWATR